MYVTYSLPQLSPISPASYGPATIGNPGYGLSPMGMPGYGLSSIGNTGYGISPFGNTGYGTSPFGYGISPFGTSPLGTGISPFGSSAFGTPAFNLSPIGTPAYGVSPYGGSPYGFSPFGAPAYGLSPFGTPTYGTSPFGFGPTYAIAPNTTPITWAATSFSPTTGTGTPGIGIGQTSPSTPWIAVQTSNGSFTYVPVNPGSPEAQLAQLAGWQLTPGFVPVSSVRPNVAQPPNGGAVHPAWTTQSTSPNGVSAHP